MDKLGTGLLIAIGLGALVIVGSTIGAFFGSVSGWVVGWVFDDTSAKVLAHLGMVDFEMWEVGAALGFFAGFFRATITTSS